MFPILLVNALLKSMNPVHNKSGIRAMVNHTQHIDRLEGQIRVVPYLFNSEMEKIRSELTYTTQNLQSAVHTLTQSYGTLATEMSNLKRNVEKLSEKLTNPYFSNPVIKPVIINPFIPNQPNTLPHNNPQIIPTPIPFTENLENYNVTVKEGRGDWRNQTPNLPVSYDPDERILQSERYSTSYCLGKKKMEDPLTYLGEKIEYKERTVKIRRVMRKRRPRKESTQKKNGRRKQRRRRKLLRFFRKRGSAKVKKEKTARAAGNNGGNTNLHWDGCSTGNHRKKKKEKKMQEQERNVVDKKRAGECRDARKKKKDGGGAGSEEMAAGRFCRRNKFVLIGRTVGGGSGSNADPKIRLQGFEGKGEISREENDKDSWPEKWVAGNWCWSVATGTESSAMEMEILEYGKEGAAVVLRSMGFNFKEGATGILRSMGFNFKERDLTIGVGFLIRREGMLGLLKKMGSSWSFEEEKLGFKIKQLLVDDVTDDVINDVSTAGGSLDSNGFFTFFFKVGQIIVSSRLWRNWGIFTVEGQANFYPP